MQVITIKTAKRNPWVIRPRHEHEFLLRLYPEQAEMSHELHMVVTVYLPAHITEMSRMHIQFWKYLVSNFLSMTTRQEIADIWNRICIIDSQPTTIVVEWQ